MVRDAENYILTQERMDERVYSIVSYTHNRFISQQTLMTYLGLERILVNTECGS